MWVYIIGFICILLCILAIAGTFGLAGILLAGGWQRFVIRVGKDEVIAYPKPEIKLLWIPRVTFSYGIINNSQTQQLPASESSSIPATTYQVLPPSQSVKSPMMIEAAKLLGGHDAS